MFKEILFITQYFNLMIILNDRYPVHHRKRFCIRESMLINLSECDLFIIIVPNFISILCEFYFEMKLF